MIDRAWGVLTKELRQWRRDPQAAAAPMVLALVLVALSAVRFGQGGDAWPAGIANQSPGPAGAQLARTFDEARSRLSPYFNIVTRNAIEAQQLVEDGRLQMAVTIPEDFDERVSSGGHASLDLDTFNINTDVTKNVQLRLDHVIQQYMVEQGSAPGHHRWQDRCGPCGDDRQCCRDRGGRGGGVRPPHPF